MAENAYAGRIVVVTGAGSGIGQTCVEVFQQSGATVIGWDLRPADDSTTAVDVSDWDSVSAAAADVKERYGRVDALVNCAGIITPNLPAEETDPEDFRKTFNVNVMGIVNTTKALFPLLLESDSGAVVNIASQAALVSLPHQAAYTASKGAVAALTRALAIDWASRGVRVNAVCPGFTATPMAVKQMTPALEEALARRVPLGRMFETEEIANAIQFLSSPLASAITGVVLPVDGGWTAGEPALPM
ncbi:SDR family NAD(P)-dependent oxidoreductase [Leucobacter sp. USHLN153]|uniref:SDR family NAD(P)-dependent oxidoreductase n=1 Tax=Leucobacter sp. USHLN153 TaxID=3081268 RepID=UPI0030160E43